MRMQTVKSVKAQNPDIKVALLCDKVSDATIADKVKGAKEEGAIDAFFYESVPSDYEEYILSSIKYGEQSINEVNRHLHENVHIC